MNLKMVELLCPYDNWEQVEVKDMYTKLISLKIEGFSKSYKDLLAVDSYDLIADHVIICDDRDGDLFPLSSYKILKTSIVERFKLPLPCCSMLEALNKEGKAEKHLKSLCQFIDQTKRKGKDTVYTSSWTTHSHYRSKSAWGDKIKSSLLAMLYFYKDTFDIPTAIIIGMKHLKTDKLFLDIGYKKASFEGKELGHLLNHNFDNREALLLFLENFSPFYTKMAETHRAMYENRVVVGDFMDRREVA